MEPQIPDRKELYRVLTIGDQKLTIGADKTIGIFIYDKAIQNYKKGSEGFLVYFAEGGGVIVVANDFKNYHVSISDFIGVSVDEEQTLKVIVENYLSKRKAIIDDLILNPPSIQIRPNSSNLPHQSVSSLTPCGFGEPPEPYDPPLEEFDSYDHQDSINQSYEEASDYNDSGGRSNDEGWFYSDDD